MKNLFAILVLLVTVAGCSKENDRNKQICNLADPINELPWLKEIKNSLTRCGCETSIMQATYKEQTIFYTATTDLLCDGIETYTLYNCEGKVIEIITQDKIHDFYTKVTDLKNLYVCKN